MFLGIIAEGYYKSIRWLELTIGLRSVDWLCNFQQTNALFKTLAHDYAGPDKTTLFKLGGGTIGILLVKGLIFANWSLKRQTLIRRIHMLESQYTVWHFLCECVNLHKL